MKKDLLELIKQMYTHLDTQYTQLHMQGRGDMVHNIANGRATVQGHLQLLKEDLAKEKLPSSYTYDYIGKMLQVYDRKETQLFRLLKKAKQNGR